MNPDRAIEIAGESYPLAFTTNAQYQLGLYLRKNGLGTVSELIGRLVGGESELVDIQIIFWALLEGGRRRDRSRMNAFTLDEVGDMIDESGGLSELAKSIVQAVSAASPKADGTAKAGTRKKVRRTTGTGTRSSSRPRKPASRTKPSGT